MNYLQGSQSSLDAIGSSPLKLRLSIPLYYPAWLLMTSISQSTLEFDY
jgi:hypothetical protein